MVYIAVDSVLENLKQLLNCSVWWSPDDKDQIASFYKELEFLGIVLKDMMDKRYEHEKLNDLLIQIRDIAQEGGDIVGVLLIKAFKYMRSMHTAEEIDHFSFPYDFQKICTMRKEIKSITNEMTQIHEKKLYDFVDPQVGMSSRGSSSRAIAPNVDEEAMIGFEHEAEMIKEQLTGSPNQLDVISIVGMAGLGKTTLARKVYNDPFIVYHFYIRVWIYVSQVYKKRDLLFGILSSIIGDKKDAICSTMNKEKLEEELYRRLKGMRYLIVIDDIWNVEAWDDLNKCFPNDSNGSRILFTTRLKEVALHANKPGCSPHYLPFLTQNESWDLLQLKIFGKGSCPLELMKIGRQIAGNCQGLPLAIVVVAGLLAKTSKTQDWWKKVAENVSSYIVGEPKNCMDTLALSYNYLPYHLKPCFLYFGTFPEDYEIPMRKLILLWIAEGFISQIGQRSLENVAEEYLMDLVDRSLVSIAKKKCTGGIRACRIHDLLRDLCLRKAKEENFLSQCYVNKDLKSVLRIPITGRSPRLCIHSRLFKYISPKRPYRHIRSFLCFPPRQSYPHGISFFYQRFKLLKVLDLSAIFIDQFPSGIVELLLLKYMALKGQKLLLPESLHKLWNLETLIVSEGTGVEIPLSIWKMVKLRHLYIAGENYISDIGDDGYSLILENMQTISQVIPSRSCQNVLAKTPNLGKLGFCGSLIENGNLKFPDLDGLHHLESLKLLNKTSGGPPHDRLFNSLQQVKFPPHLKRLTLSRTFLDWKEMSILGMLNNLEALKLEYQAFYGQCWETSEGGFHKLKYLKLYCMNIELWNASSIHFPNLEHLVIHKCEKLVEIPSELGDIPTLHTIDVNWCSRSSVHSARQIQEEQQNNGNDFLQIFISPPDWELTL